MYINKESIPPKDVVILSFPPKFNLIEDPNKSNF